MMRALPAFGRVRLTLVRKSGDNGLVNVVMPRLGAEDLARLLRSIAQLSSRDALFQELASTAIDATCADTAIVAMVEQDSMLHFVSVVGAQSEELRGMRIRVADSFLAPAMETNEPVVATIGQNGLARHALACVICGGGEPMGVLAVVGDEQRLSPDAASTVALLSDVAQVATLTGDLCHSNARLEHEIGLLSESSIALAESQHPSRTADLVAQSVSDYFEAGMTLLLLEDDVSRELVVAAQRGLDPEHDRFDGHGIVESALRAGRPTRLPDADGLLPSLLPALMRSALVAPLVRHGKPLGALVVASKEPDAYTEEDEAMIAAVGAQAAIAIENAMLYDDATRLAREAARLYQLSQGLNEASDDAQRLNLACIAAQKICGFDRCAAFLVSGKRLRLVASHLMPASFDGYAPKIGIGVVGWAVEAQSPTYAVRLEADPRNRHAPLPLDAAGAVCVPLHVGEEALGALLGVSNQERSFTLGDVETFYTIGNLASAALRRRAKRTS